MQKGSELGEMGVGEVVREKKDEEKDLGSCCSWFC